MSKRVHTRKNVHQGDIQAPKQFSGVLKGVFTLDWGRKEYSIDGVCVTTLRLVYLIVLFSE